MYRLTPWIRRLLVINVAVHLCVMVGAIPPALWNELAFVPLRPAIVDGALSARPDILYKPWTAVTYTFLHGGLWHLGFNMLVLFFFGPRLEERLGGGNFVKLYFLSGIAGALLSYVIAPGPVAIIGASGAVYGVVAGFAHYWPRERVYIWGVLPMEVWQLMVVAVVLSIVFQFGSAGGGIAHMAHLGGLGFGYGYVRWLRWRRGADKREFQRKLDPKPGGSFDRGSMRRWESIDLDRLHEINREEVRDLLEKARASGVRSLTSSERQFMDRMASASGR